MKNVMGLVFANIYDSSLGQLTNKRTQASLPYGGRYRQIDFTLSNMANAGIRHIGIVTQYNFQSLMNHVGSGEEWDLELEEGGLEFITPYSMGVSNTFRGKLEAIAAASSSYLERGKEEYIILADAAVICAIDLQEVMDAHIASGKDVTVVVKAGIANGKKQLDLAVRMDKEGEISDMAVDYTAPADYLASNLRTLRIVAMDPWVAGSDIIGEEINDILELHSVIRELVAIAGENPGFVLQIHAGENDSLRDNVANSIRCVVDSLQEGQPMPPLRIGHGLYTCDLRSAKGKKLLEDMRNYDVTLEFQISSNVRLNNLSHLERHPLQQYLKAGIRCIQGTDGGALYGTNSIDEELSLEKLLGLTHEELCRMRNVEDDILLSSREVFEKKTAAFRDICPGGDTELFYRRKLECTGQLKQDLWQDSGKIDAEEALKHRISPLPGGCFPIVLAGGSFNNSQHRTQLRQEDKEFLDALLKAADPEKIVFVVGHTLTGQEGYLARQAQGRVPVYAIVPGMISQAEKNRLKSAGIPVILSIENASMGLYKSFSYEIF